MKILLCCNLGMSTSLLMNKIKDAAKLKNIDLEIWAIPVGKIQLEVDKADIVLLGPQIKYEYNNVKKITDAKNKKLDVINMSDYGMLRGDKVLEKVIEILNQ